MTEPPQTPALPSEGDYIVLRLNVSATRAMFGVKQDDSDVPRGTQPYVGYLHEILDFPDPSRAAHKCRIRLLSSGRPLDNPVDGSDPSMCVSVHPATDVIGGRPPLNVSKTLPWNNCFHHSALSVTLRIRAPSSDAAIECTRITEDDMFEHDFFVQEDEEKRKLRRMARWRATASDSDAHGIQSTGSFIGISSAKDLVQRTTIDVTNEVENFNTATSSRSDTDIDEDEPLPVVDVSYDLSALNVLHDPRNLLQEIAEVLG